MVCGGWWVVCGVWWVRMLFLEGVRSPPLMPHLVHRLLQQCHTGRVTSVIGEGHEYLTLLEREDGS